MTESPEFVGITPYLHSEDILGAIEWLTWMFGFVEKDRWLDADGRFTNAELIVGADDHAALAEQLCLLAYGAIAWSQLTRTSSSAIQAKTMAQQLVRGMGLLPYE
jgi:uncharacterized glyoxalase superfamily protein PhnB